MKNTVQLLNLTMIYERIEMFWQSIIQTSQFYKPNDFFQICSRSVELLWFLFFIFSNERVLWNYGWLMNFLTIRIFLFCLKKEIWWFKIIEDFALFNDWWPFSTEGLVKFLWLVIHGFNETKAILCKTGTSDCHVDLNSKSNKSQPTPHNSSELTMKLH